MNEENIIKELFRKSDLSYSTEGMEEMVWKKLEIKSIYRKKQQRYAFFGKVGFSFIVILSLLFTMSIRAANSFDLIIAPTIIMFLLMFPLEFILDQKKSTTAQL